MLEAPTAEAPTAEAPTAGTDAGGTDALEAPMPEAPTVRGAHVRRDSAARSPTAAGQPSSAAACGIGSTCGSDNKCQQCPATDLPDDAFFDQNCDGIDGQLDGGIFLSPTGNDSAPGTRSQPVASLAKAFTLAQTAPHKTIYIASGTYDAGTPSMLWNSPVSLYGGYSRTSARATRR